MSAMTGIGLAALIRPRASAAGMSRTAQRTSSQPASASRPIWASVAATSRVSVEHMDCTEQGAPPPIFTFPIRICLVGFCITGHSSQIQGEKSRRVWQVGWIKIAVYQPELIFHPTDNVIE